MAVPFLKVYYTPPEGTEIEITDLVDVQHKRGLEIKSSKADIVINDARYKYKDAGQTIFVEDGLIEIYADYAPITKSNAQLILSGQIREVAPSVGEKAGRTKITIADKTVLLLGSLWSKDYQNLTTDQIIRNLLTDSPVDGAVTSNNVATTTTAGSAFPTLTSYAKNFKPLYEWINELSQPGYTGEDRAYIFYIDKDNDLHWFYPSQTVDDTIQEGVDDIYDMGFKKNADALVNMVIFNAGQDLNGNGVLWYYFDSTSKSNELRMKYYPMTDLSTGQTNGLFDLEIGAGNLVQTTTGDVPYKGLLYADQTPVTTSWGQAVADRSAYNDAWRDYLKELGAQRAKAITQRFSKLLWQGNIRLRGSNSYVAGNLLEVTSETCGLLSQKLRIYDVAHSFGNDGWITTLQVKEDEASVTAESVPGS